MQGPKPLSMLLSFWLEGDGISENPIAIHPFYTITVGKSSIAPPLTSLASASLSKTCSEPCSESPKKQSAVP
jgi:hypothetical protein